MTKRRFNATAPRNKKLQVLMTENEIAAVEMMCSSKGISLSSYTRDVLLNAIEREASLLTV